MDRRSFLRSSAVFGIAAASDNTPWCEMFLPPPGGPKEVYDRFEEEHQIARGPDGISMRPPDSPGFGFDLDPAPKRPT